MCMFNLYRKFYKDTLFFRLKSLSMIFMTTTITLYIISWN